MEETAKSDSKIEGINTKLESYPIPKQQDTTPGPQSVEPFPNIRTNETNDPCSAQWIMVRFGYLSLFLSPISVFQLYTYATYTSENPDPSEQQMLSDFFTHFPDQCTTGPSANCYSDALRTMPPRCFTFDLSTPFFFFRVANRRELLLWLCSVENRCRKQAGVPTRLCR